ncbi:hypothetical protein [Polymorphum gilvum]|uniref:Uncharacterized protein n=1 Tax=Polymorphum gilvum (strain LMG 25793 / CGMCC 1.9160 / SL003B-26A1) TaxID=991905 RepID=F2IYC1_POLGS|nr:hypothetical protein [Polymorphum gilvum]ADZ71733.1 hypothetical protein SL003B_3311 [Polymorphum gilvum SL003B-26A1]
MTALRTAAFGMALLAGGWLALAATPAAARQVDSFKTGNWNGNAYVDDATGKFASCVASVSYVNGITLSVQVDGSYNWFLGFSSPNWTLKVGSSFTLSYRIDRGDWRQGTATVIDATLARMPMPADGYIITRFRRGQAMFIHDGQRSYDFRLTGTSRLMARLADCVRVNAARYGAGPAIAGAAPPEQPAQEDDGGEAAPDPKLQIEATQALFNLMGKARLSGLSFIDEDDRTEDYQGVHAVAGNAARLLAAHIFEEGDYASEQQLMAAMISDSAKTCEGAFQSGSQRRSVDGASLLTGFSRCVGDARSLEERYVVAPRGKGGVYVFAVADTRITAGEGAPLAPYPLDDETLFAAAAAAAR